MSKAYFYARHSLLGMLAYRGFFYSLALQWFIPPLIAMFAWIAVLKSSGQTAKLDWLIANYLVTMIVNQFTYSYEFWTTGMQIRNGSYSRNLILPYHPLLQSLAENFGSKMLFMVMNVPLVLLLWLIFQPHVDWSAANVVYFMVSLVLASLTRFLMGLTIACTAFWISRSDALLVLNDSLLFLLGGQAAPIAFLPEFLRGAAQFLPFYMVLGLPATLLLTPITLAEALHFILWQCVWLTVFLAAGVMAWKFGVRKYQATGG